MYAIFATLKTKPGMAETFAGLLGELAVSTRTEPGSRLYVFGRAAEPDTFLIMERYESKEAFKAHFTTPHYMALSPKLAECLDSGKRRSVRFTEIDV
jgi:quinol monooxygenase YgiN